MRLISLHMQRFFNVFWTPNESSDVSCLVTNSCTALCNSMDYTSCSSVHGTLQVRILGWVAISFSRGSSQPRDRTCISCIYRWTLPQSHEESPKGKWCRSKIVMFPPKMRNRPIRRLGILFSKTSHPKGNPSNTVV